MRRRRYKRNTTTSKLGLLFIVLILSLASIGASYAHWEDILNIYADMETTEWEIKDCDFRIGYEDLPITICYEGCSHGFWGHNGLDDWVGYQHGDILGNVFSNAYIYGLQDDTLYQALGYGGGSTPTDKARILLRNAVASLLNAAHPQVNYPLTLTQVITQVNDALGSGVPAMETLEPILDGYNNLGGGLCGGGCGCSSNNDYDYNDFVVDIDIDGLYIQNYLVELNFTFEAMARGAAYHHDLLLFIPSGTFGVDGTYTLTYYDKDENPIGSPVTAPFLDTSDINLTIFPNTWDALPPTPPHSWCANAIDDTVVQIGRTTTVQFNFSGFFCDALDLNDYTLDDIGVHGKDLFFNPQLYVWNTGEYIDQEDPRFVPAPNNWIWPQEFAAIWTVYPYDGGNGEGVTEGNPPTFTQHWYTKTLTNPTTYKWDPLS